jgi:hypothetical protein
MIMATAAYITANAPNNNEHMAKLQAYALEGICVLQTEKADDPTRDLAPRRPDSVAQQHLSQLAALVVAPRPHGVQPINGELRHALSQNKVD